MNPNAVLKFLQSLRSLAKSGVIKSVDEAFDFAKREFGEINDLFKRQIEQVFKKPVDKAPKPGEGGITSIKNAPKKETPDQASGIMATEEATTPLMQNLEKGVETLKAMKKPGMDLSVGLTRTAVRKILDREGIQIPDKVDPIDFFTQKYGADILMDVKNVAEEMIELEQMGKATKSMDEILEQEGMFNLPKRKNPPQGYTDEEMADINKEIEQENILLDFDTTDRTENSMGGINRVAYRYGSGKSLIKFVKGKDNLLKKIKQAVNDIFTTDDIKYDADVAVDTMLEDLGVDRSMFDQKDIIDAYSMAYNELKIPLLQNLKNKPVKSIESMKKTGTLNISDPEIAGEMDRFAKQADPEGYKKMEEAIKKAADEAQPIEYFLGTRKKNSKGGLNYLMGM